MNYRLFLVLIILLHCTFMSISQEVTKYFIKGKVNTIEGPLPGATIQIKGRESGVVSNDKGYFFIDDIPAGQHVISLRSVGYKPISKSIVVDKDLTMDFFMEQSVVGLEGVVITGTMEAVFISQSPVKVEVLTSEHLTTYLPSAATGVMESISLINGVQEVVACGVCFTNSISIHGLPGAYTAILMDGAPIYGNLASVYGLNGIPQMIIDRFEVIKGPNSTLYGSEAVAGVINVITKDPEEQEKLSIDVMGTSHLELFGNLGIAPKTKIGNGFVGINYAYINDFEDNNEDGFSDIVNLDRISVFTKWDFNRKSGRSFSLSGKYYYEDRRNGVEQYLMDRNYRHLRGSNEIYGESIFTYRGELFGTYELIKNLTLNYSFSHHKQDSYYGDDYYYAKQSIGFSNIIWNSQYKKHELTGGVTIRIQHYDDNTVATAALLDGVQVNKADNQFIPGVFIQDEWKVSDDFSILSGIRLDNYEHHGNIFSPRLSTKFNPGEWTTIRGNFGTGFRVVNLFTEDHAFVSGQRTVVIEDDLKPEESYNFSINLNHIYIIDGTQGMLDIDVYYTHFTNKIIPDYDTENKIIYGNTDGYAVTKGISINTTQEFSFPLSFNIGANFQKATATEGTTSAIEFAPQWSGIFTANYKWKRRDLSIAYTMKLTGPMALPEVYDLDNQGQPKSISRPTTSSKFAIHNMQVSKDFHNYFSVYGGLQNIFNYIQDYSPLIGYNDPNTNPGFSNHFDTSYAFSPIHGRELYIGIKWTID